VLLSQRSRWLLAAIRKPLLRPLRRLLMPQLPLPHLPPMPLLQLHLLLTVLLRPLRLPTPLLRLPLRLNRLSRTDPTGSGMRACAGRNAVCAGFRVFEA